MSNGAGHEFKKFENIQPDGHIWYYAGLPGYPRNFSRDVIIAGILACNPVLLGEQLEVSAQYQGSKNNVLTGEKNGKIHHELPGVPYRIEGRETTYNACDTTALFLIAAEMMMKIDAFQFKQFMKDHKSRVIDAIGYIFSAMDNNHLVWETPPPGTDGYALNVTYWKDSCLPNPEGKTEPAYPVFYPQAHFIAARGILSAGRILKDRILNSISGKMFESGIAASIQPNWYLAYKDSEEELRQPSSDELHSLAYIPVEYIDLLPLEALKERAAEHLRTPFGYACTPPEIAQHLKDRYHGNKVWVFEQAKIHYGASKFGLVDEMEVSASVGPYIGRGQELFGVLRKKHEVIPIPEGNARQLWSVAAIEYFAGRSALMGSNLL